MRKLKTKNKTEQRGSILFETAISIPFLIYITFMGFELTRLADLQLVKRDISRVLTLTHVCAFRQPAAAKICYNESIDNVKKIYGNRFKDSQVFIQNYRVKESDADSRIAKCGSYAQAKSIKISKTSDSSLNGTKPSFSRYGVAVDNDNLTLANIIPPGDDATAKQLCRNGQVTIAEFYLKRVPFVSLDLKKIFNGHSKGTEVVKNSNEGREAEHYELGVI